MNASNRWVDHIVLAVRDLEAARTKFAAFGFTTTPPARHPFGTGNSLIQLEHNFIELLTVVDAAKLVPTSEQHFSFGAYNDRFLAKREGMSMLVFSSNDAHADASVWRTKGLTTFEPVHFSRKATLPDGSEATVAFTIAFVLDNRMPETAFFVCQQHTPEAFWQSSYQAHTNHGKAIASVTMVADDPGDYERFFSEIIGADKVLSQGEKLLVSTAHGSIEVITVSDASERFPSISVVDAEGPFFLATSIRVADLSNVGRLLRANTIRFSETKAGIQIPPEEAFGMALEFVDCTS